MLVGLKVVESMPSALHNCMLQPALAPLDTQEMHVKHVIQVSKAALQQLFSTCVYCMQLHFQSNYLD